MIKFSILIPAYKVLFLKEAINSIVGQTYKNWELIIVDDCSPNDLRSIVDEFDECRMNRKKTTFASMIDERAYELALSQLAQAREEKMLLFEQVKHLTEEVALLRSSSANRADEQAATIKELTAKISELSAQVEKLNARIDHLNEVIQMKDEVIKAKNQEIKNLKYEVANGVSTVLVLRQSSAIS